MIKLGDVRNAAGLTCEILGDRAPLPDEVACKLRVPILSDGLKAADARGPEPRLQLPDAAAAGPGCIGLGRSEVSPAACADERWSTLADEVSLPLALLGSVGVRCPSRESTAGRSSGSTSVSSCFNACPCHTGCWSSPRRATLDDLTALLATRVSLERAAWASPAVS